jgi:inosine-uridine nucleoside N-ribohydrolase
MKKVIVDCDVGVDDVLALILAFHSSELADLSWSGRRTLHKDGP